MDPGVTTFVGSNGQGKTNLVEAVEYLSTLGSHRVTSDTPLVRLGATQAVVRGKVRAGTDDARALLIEVEINPGRANRARINRAPVARSRDVLGVLRTVVFSPGDLDVVRGDPSDRRTFLDSLLVTRWPRMAGVRADYDRVLKQRNALLKSLAGRGAGAGALAGETLEIWDAQLATVGAELLSARLDTLSLLMPSASRAYGRIAPVNDVTTADYRSTIDLDGLWTAPTPEGGSSQVDRAGLAERFHDALAARRRDELVRGVTLVGPQRDDVVLHIGPMPAKGYASHGESWSLALALRLASFELLRADGIEPVLVLDDVFAELDATRRSRLAESVVDADQVLVTAAVAGDVPAMLRGRRFDVGGGQVVAHEEVSGDG
ncbi:DNA replication/repair protein RecF [Acidipropionibacterium timonense]|uniref:DNA replication/repair protein RecF n=1 Tax=Acidipropionibacterium timonense TaxID=2161818 RepID=UPI001FD91E72|nr:DNA replication/repair protein RecF [Acidipropionibacterium timonense]